MRRLRANRGNRFWWQLRDARGESPAPTLVAPLGAASSGAAEPSFTEFSRSPTLRSYSGIMPLRMAPRARGPREIRTCSKMAGAAATMCGCLERRSRSAGQSLMPSSAMRCRVMCDVEPSRRCWRSWRNPLVMAMATTSEATPAATPAMEMPVMMPMKACLLLARRYRVAMKSSKRMAKLSAVSSQLSAKSDYSGKAPRTSRNLRLAKNGIDFGVLWSRNFHAMQAISGAGDGNLWGCRSIKRTGNSGLRPRNIRGGTSIPDELRSTEGLHQNP